MDPLVVIDCSTGHVETRDPTASDIAQQQADRAMAQKIAAQRDADTATRGTILAKVAQAAGVSPDDLNFALGARKPDAPNRPDPPKTTPGKAPGS